MSTNSLDNGADRFRWPGGHRAALCLTFDVDGPYGERNYQPDNGPAIAQTEYEPFGLQRILGILADADISATFCWVGQEAQDRPHLVKEAFELGHEIAVHTWDHRYYTTMSTDEQRADITRTVDALNELTGTRPIGHKTAGWRFTTETPAVCQQAGLRWAMDIPRGDLPFIMQPDPERPALIQLPPTCHGDDYSFFVDGLFTPAAAFEFWRDELDVVRAEGLLMSLTMHPFVMGRPAPSRTLVRFLDYAIDLGDIWIARADQIAAWWLENLAPASETL